jgi:hypothetical protein
MEQQISTWDQVEEAAVQHSELGQAIANSKGVAQREMDSIKAKLANEIRPLEDTQVQLAEGITQFVLDHRSDFPEDRQTKRLPRVTFSWKMPPASLVLRTKKDTWDKVLERVQHNDQELKARALKSWLIEKLHDMGLSSAVIDKLSKLPGILAGYLRSLNSRFGQLMRVKVELDKAAFRKAFADPMHWDPGELSELGVALEQNPTVSWERTPAEISDGGLPQTNSPAVAGTAA